MIDVEQSPPIPTRGGKNVPVNYITNLPLTEISGGWSGFNAAVFEGLSRRFDLTYVGPVSPAMDQRARIVSKARRSLGLRGSFPFFSERRLHSISLELRARISTPDDFTFFHGSTPWIAYVPPGDYACFVDVCFDSYMTVYHDRRSFDERDLRRIAEREANWMSRASRVYFSSRWALEETVAAYGLSRDNLSVVGLGGNMSMPQSDSYAGGRDFIFVALDFVAKGGQVCVDALREVRARFPAARLRIIGGAPPHAVLSEPGVSYEGLLSKSRPEELTKLRELLSSAFALLLPTTRDATPLVIVEAAYFGCPAIATRAFGIPEMVLDGVTGLLVEPPPTSSAVAAQMISMCEDAAYYRRMRAAARARATEDFTWERMTSLVADGIVASIA